MIRTGHSTKGGLINDLINDYKSVCRERDMKQRLKYMDIDDPMHEKLDNMDWTSWVKDKQMSKS